MGSHSIQCGYTASFTAAGAGRDAIEFILKARGVLEQTIEQSIDERNPLPANMDIGKGGF